MADTDKRLLIRLEADNKKLLTKLDQSQKKIKSFENASGDSIVRATNKLKRQNEQIIQTTGRMAQAANDSTRSFARFGSGAGRAGVQIQQFVGQVQGGQNALLALSQQAADIGIVLGAPLIGVFVSLAAALTATNPKVQEFISGMLSSKSASDRLKEGLEALQERVSLNADGTLEYTKRIKDLAKVSKAAAEVELSIALIQAEANIATATKGIVGSVSEIEDRFKRVESTIKTSSISGQFRLPIETQLKMIRKSIGLTAEETEKFRVVARRLIEDPSIENAVAFNKLAKTFDLNNEKIRGFVVEFNTYLQALNNGKATIERLKGVLTDFDPSSVLSGDKDKDNIQAQKDSALKSFESLRESLLREEDAIRASYQERNRVIDDALREKAVTLDQAYALGEALTIDRNNKLKALEAARVEQTKNFVAQSLGVIQSGLDKESGLAKAAFAARQGILIAETIMNTEAQARETAKQVGGFGGEAAAAAVRALGYASVGIIAGQTIASFEGGGMTPSGPRAGGMDGKGGMLAMLHPNEKVTDLTRAGNDGDGWKVEINNYAGAQVSQSIDDNKKVVSIMVEQASNTNSEFGRVMQTKYQNIRPKGGR